MSTCGDVGSFIESKTLVVQTSNVGFTSEVPDYLVVHTGPDVVWSCVGAVWEVIEVEVLGGGGGGRGAVFCGLSLLVQEC